MNIAIIGNSCPNVATEIANECKELGNWLGQTKQPAKIIQ